LFPAAVEEFEKAVKKKFIEEPGQMKLLIVVDKLLTGFDAPRPLISTSTSRCATTVCSSHLPRESAGR